MKQRFKEGDVVVLMERYQPKYNDICATEEGEIGVFESGILANLKLQMNCACGATEWSDSIPFMKLKKIGVL